jgi:hypothetical protein
MVRYGSRPARFAIIFASLLLTIGGSATAQTIEPLPRKFNWDEIPIATFWGQGKTQSNEKDEINPLASASAKFIVTVMPFPNTVAYAAGNKGAGLERVSQDSLELSSIGFPEAGNSAFLGKLQYAIPLNGSSAERRHSLPIFVDYAWQRRTVAPVEPGADLVFDTSTFYYGVGYAFTKASEDDPFRLQLLFAFTTLQVSDASLSDYRQVFRNPNLQDKLNGFGVKTAIQYNDFGVEFGYLDLKDTDGNDVPGLSGGLFNLAFTASGRLLDIAK